MCRFLLCFVLCATCACTAHADTYDFYVHECLFGDCTYAPSPDDTLEFQISGAPNSYDSSSVTYNNINILQAGSSAGDGPNVQISRYGFTLFGPNGAVPGVYPEFDDSFVIYEFNKDLPLFTGSPGNPVFQTGVTDVGTSHTYYGYGNEYSGVLTVTDLNAVPTPELSSLALLGTGLVGLFGVAARRFGKG